MAGDERGHERESAQEAYEPPRVEDVDTEDSPTSVCAAATQPTPLQDVQT